MSSENSSRRRKSFVGFGAFYFLFLFLFESSPSSFFFVRSENHPPGRILQSVRREGEWVIKEVIDKNNFDLDYVPDAPPIKVTDVDTVEDIRATITYSGKCWLNAWAADEDFDSAPKYVESFTGMKYASTYKRFERSEQAYAYNFLLYETNKDDNRTR